MKRREFLKTTSLSVPLLISYPELTRGTQEKLKILVLGGTNYIGPPIVHTAIERGHTVTLFNRGITNPHLFAGIERLVGDRDVESEDLTALYGDRRWDCVIDTWTADPRMVENAARLLKSRTKSYVFISSIAVYKDKTKVGIIETDPLHEVSGFTPGMSYYQSKVLCEQKVQDYFPEQHVILRPPSIFGKRDESWSLVYWLWRVRNGGPVLAPSDGKDFISWIDVDDLGSFAVHAVENLNWGIYNTIGPKNDPVTFSQFLTSLNRHYGDKSTFTWVNQEFLEGNDIRPIVDIPLWEPKNRRTGFHLIDAQKAKDAGLTFRSMGQTFDSALNWYDEVRGGEIDPATDKSRPFNGITRARELELLELWKNWN